MRGAAVPELPRFAERMEGDHLSILALLLKDGAIRILTKIDPHP